MKTIIAFLAIALFAIYGAYAQRSLNDLSLTQVLPAAPNAFEITRYSGLPVNLATGSVSATIPMGTIKSGRISVPVSLTYNSGNGVLINQTASRVGMSWVMNAGGVITRTVYNNPDEESQWVTPPPGPFGESSAMYNYLDSATSATTGRDAQVDIFNFNFNGFSGQFYLKPSQKTKVVMIQASNLKVETNFFGELAPAGNWTFRITDAQGTRYYFGGDRATEKSKTTSYGCGRNFLTPTASAWYLVAVQHYTGEYIWLTYNPVTVKYFADVSQTMIRKPDGTQYYCGAGGNCPARYDSQVCFSEFESTGVILSSINSRFQRVNFIYSDRNDIDGDKLLSRVNFFSKGAADSTELINYDTYDLSYTVTNNTAYYNNYGNSSILRTCLNF